MPALGYTAITNPRLWPSDTLQEARLEILDMLGNKQTSASRRQELLPLQEAIETVLANRHQKLRPAR